MSSGKIASKLDVKDSRSSIISCRFKMDSRFKIQDSRGCQIFFDVCGLRTRFSPARSLGARADEILMDGLFFLHSQFIQMR